VQLACGALFLNTRRRSARRWTASTTWASLCQLGAASTRLQCTPHGPETPRPPPSPSTSRTPSAPSPAIRGLKADDLAFLLPTFELLYREAATISFEGVPASVQGDIKVETGVVQGNVFSSLFYIRRRCCARCRTPSQQSHARVWQITRPWQVPRRTPSASLWRWRTGLLRTAWHCSCPRRRCYWARPLRMRRDPQCASGCKQAQSQQSATGSSSRECPLGVTTTYGTPRLPWLTGWPASADASGS